ncbi:MAG: helix-turn-helix domain-containing protein [Polyangiales bacterium]
MQPSVPPPSWVHGESLPPSIDLPPTGKRLFAVGGGKGGVGKSVVAGNLAVYLAQIGRRVVLVDADATGANLHLVLGAEEAAPTVAEVRDEELPLITTAVPGLRLLTASSDPAEGGALKTARKARLITQLRTIDADDIVIDVGPGTSASACDMFLVADVGVLVTVPEPAAIESTYRFLRALYVRDVRRALRADRTRLRALDRILGELPRLPYPLDLARHVARVEPSIAEVCAQLLTRTRPRLVVNQTRVRQDLELGSWMSLVSERRLGIDIDALGSIEHDDAVWLANRRRRPLLVDNPSSKSGRGLERVCRRLLAVMPHRARELEARGVLPEAPNHYERLQIPRGASEEEVRRAYKRQREIWAGDGLATISLFTSDELSREHALLDEAHDVLLDPPRRRAYDVSVFPDHESPRVPSPGDRLIDAAVAAELRELQAQVARELGPDTEFSGALLRRVRESRGVDVREIAGKTKISGLHISAIEDEAFDQLPPLVYVRGFLVEMAKFLKLDPSQVARTYLRRAKELLELRGG